MSIYVKELQYDSTLSNVLILDLVPRQKKWIIQLHTYDLTAHYFKIIYLLQIQQTIFYTFGHGKIFVQTLSRV